MSVLSQQQFNELKDFLAEQQRDLITLSHQNRDKETSGLHREILDKLSSHEIWRDELNIKLDKLEAFVVKATPTIDMAKNLSWAGKGILAICAAIAIISGGIIGLKEIIHNVPK